MKLLIIGGGRAAWTMASLWRKSGNEIVGIALRPDSTSRVPRLLAAERFDVSRLPDRFDAVLFAVPDDTIADSYATVEKAIPSTATVFHASGFVPSSVFARHEVRFSLHPLCSLPPAGADLDLSGTVFVFEGAIECLPLASAIAEAAGAKMASIEAAAKPAYHAAAVIASNYVATLLTVARDEMQRCGIDLPLDEPLARLARSAIANWAAGGERFTGPVARGDAGVISKHLEALAARPDRERLYRELAAELCSAALEIQPERSDLKALRERLRADNSS